MQDASVIVPGVSIDALGLQSPGTSIEVESQLQMQGRICKFSGGLNDGIQINMIIETSEVSQAGNSVNALMLGNLGMKHPTDGNAQAVLARSGLIPWEVLVQG